MTVAPTKTIVVVVAVPRTSERMSDAIVREERSMEMPPEADEGVRITASPGGNKQPKFPGSRWVRTVR